MNSTTTGSVVRCTISIEQLFINVLTWTEDDLITWIFPDGQVVQKKIDLSGSAPTNGTDQVDWTPRPYIGNSEIIINVTKKGGTGNPSFTQVEIKSSNFTLPTSFSTTQSDFSFENNNFWQANHTWDFAEGYYTYLMISYKGANPVCTHHSSAKIRIVLPPKITYIGEYHFDNESVTPPSSTVTTIEVGNLNSNRPYGHVLLKLFVSNDLNVGDPISFQINMITPPGITPCGPDSDNITQAIKRDPHDPNHKTVDIKRICNSKASTKLRYRVQFHNDGKVPVKKVAVWDPLANELIPGSFQIVSAVPQNGLEKTTTLLSIGTSKTIEFINSSSKAGLPGLAQTDVIHVYSQTIYAFEFEVLTRPNFNRDIHNYAVVTFYDNAGKPLAPISTTVETVYYGCPKTSFCKCLRSLFRPKKERPKP